MDNRTTTTDNPDRRRAVEMLRDRGVDGAEGFVTATSPQAILRTCKWFDRQPGAKPGLLVWKIRQGGVPEQDSPVSRAGRMREIFDAYTAQHPVGSRLCSHIALAARKWPGDREGCAGQLMVVGVSYPALEMECDECGFVAALTPRAMKEALA